MVDVSKLLQQTTVKKDQYDILIECLDSKCTSLRVTIENGQRCYQETVCMFDFVNVKEKLRSGQSIENIEKGSLLFLKLMLSNKNDSNNKIVPLYELPWKKVIQG